MSDYDYELAKEIKFKRYHMPTGKGDWSEEDKKTLSKMLQNSYKYIFFINKLVLSIMDFS